MYALGDIPKLIGSPRMSIIVSPGSISHLNLATPEVGKLCSAVHSNSSRSHWASNKVFDSIWCLNSA